MQSWGELGRERRGGRGNCPAQGRLAARSRAGRVLPPSPVRPPQPPTTLGFAACELCGLELVPGGPCLLFAHSRGCFLLVLVVVGKEQGYGTAAVTGGWWGPKDTVPPGGAGGAGGLHLDGREGGLQCPGRAREGAVLCAADRGHLCRCSIPPVQHEGKPLPHPWAGNQMHSHHDVPQEEQRALALPPRWVCCLPSVTSQGASSLSRPSLPHSCPIPAS